LAFGNFDAALLRSYFMKRIYRKFLAIAHKLFRYLVATFHTSIPSFQTSGIFMIRDSRKSPQK